MEYLANPFNHSINAFPNVDILWALNIVSLNLFYKSIFDIVSKLEEIQHQENIIKGDTLENDNDNDINYISEIPDIVFDNVFDDVSIDNQVKINLTFLLELNSLDRHYILYYIFKQRGLFYDGESNINTLLTNNAVLVNTYAYYKTVLNDWMNIYFSDDKLDLQMNLDDSLENNYQIVIDNFICDCNLAHVRFLSWLYYSGIYNYLMDNKENKKTVLNDMNAKKLLTGNLFLKYQLFLIEMENNDNNDNDNNDNNDNDNKDIIDVECYKEQENEQKNEQDNQDEELNMDIDELVEESVVDDDELDYNSENEEELDNRSISEDLSNINEMTFTIKLLSTVRNITIRTIISTWNIIKEEASELFHPVLG